MKNFKKITIYDTSADFAEVLNCHDRGNFENAGNNYCRHEIELTIEYRRSIVASVTSSTTCVNEYGSRYGNFEESSWNLADCNWLQSIL